MIDPNKKPVDAIRHPEDQRSVIPTSETQGEEAASIADAPRESQYAQFRHEFSRGRDPELFWLGKYANDADETCSPDLRVDIRSLYVHEDIAPEMLIKRLYQVHQEGERDGQLMLFGPDDLRTQAEIDLEQVATAYYHHQMGWKNRLIQGDSLLVMNSLLGREGMAGKVQTIYIDPPYGIKFGSNWQMKLNDRNVKESDESVSSEPEMIKAFRDTWELGIHSYLSYLRDRLVIARELLTQSGSVFVQISDENVHLVRSLLDEVFGSENFVSQIVYRKTTGAGTSGVLKGPAATCDYILWYSKNRMNMKYRPLFEEKTFGDDSMYSTLELCDGTKLSIKEWEKQNNTNFDYKRRPKGTRVCRTDNLTCQSLREGTHFPIEFNGKIYERKVGSWKTSPKGIENLIRKNRITATQNSLQYIRYYDDFPFIAVNNHWDDTTTGGSETRMYVVQTVPKVIQRCLLMTTDPGDLVLDPTCGSGTTAFVAEQWGRRWITIDTSRIALNIAKTRLTTALYPYYELFDEEGGNVRQGFKYKTVPHITLKSLANDLPPAEETLYDQPMEDKKRIRVSGPFTVETLQSYNVASPDSASDRRSGEAEAEEARLFQERIFAHLQSAGIRNGDKTAHAVFHGVEPVAHPYLHAKGWYTDADGEERLVYFHIGPKFGTVSTPAVTKALQAFVSRNRKEGASWLVLLGFSFEDTINEKDYNLGSYTVSKVRMHDDLMQEGLLKKDRNAGSFITIGEPDIRLVDDENGNCCHVEICGLDIYDPIRDDVRARSVEDIAYWELDDDYDGQQFIVREMHFCGGSKKEFAAWRKGLDILASQKTRKKAQTTLRLTFNDEVWDTLYDFRSSSFDRRPGRRIAVRVVSQFGEESTKILTVPDKDK